MTRTRRTAVAVGLLAGLASVGLASAHSGALRSSREPVAVPAWLFLSTGGGVVAASFLLASVVTDRTLVDAVDRWRRPLPAPARTLRAVGPVVGLAVAGYVVLAGLAGPAEPLRNPAVLVVWVGWWAGYVALTYLVGDAWPALDPVRALSRPLPSLDRYPARLGAWPAVAGLLALVFLEVVAPLASDPRLLAGAVLAYLAVGTAGAVAFGRAWFRRVDPVSRALAAYGRVAPVAADGDGWRLRLPGMGLTDATAVDDRSEVAFVVAVVWVTSFDGLVTTPAWATVAEAVVPGLAATTGLSPTAAALPLYAGALVVGFGGFLGAYRLAARLARRTADTYLTPATLARAFAPSLLAIAAGYHLAHFGGYFLSLSPSLAALLATPAAPLAGAPVPRRAVIPGWVGGLELAAVLVGHLLAIWVAHAAAFDRFPGRLQAVRSQYPFVAVMVAYTMTSLWIVAAPERVPPYLA